MANLTAAVNPRIFEKRINPLEMKRGGLPAVGATLYKGAMVGFNTSGLIVRAGGAAGGFNGAVQGRFIGYGPSPGGNVVTALGTEHVEFETGVFRYLIGGGSITIANRGQICYAADDQTVNLTNTNQIAGTIEDVDSLGVWVAIGLKLGATT